ncbi:MULTISPECIES: PcfJ domain-containing protein [Marinobacter]|uniref:PcfJ domain-containing protein n=1 Tax=Marinobacter xiaoshiensis TaxID=3073652 RepID=A0ABU2HH33_9GAMM|nr:PcfJ domain-containing protein [Marinobacter sp. F60267]MDS1310383.1 PcfJ domain-containing protein [Marinobacter sp. F60267]
MEPLTSRLELLDEGSTMHHCMGSYDTFIAQGEVFIYRMTAPQRLTISLEQRNNTWVVGEVRGSRNANPSQAAMDIVRRWVEL